TSRAKSCKRPKRRRWRLVDRADAGWDGGRRFWRQLQWVLRRRGIWRLRWRQHRRRWGFRELVEFEERNGRRTGSVEKPGRTAARGREGQSRVDHFVRVGGARRFSRCAFGFERALPLAFAARSGVGAHLRG